MWRVRRLHVQFYVAILATLGVLVLANILLWSLTGSWTSRGEALSSDTAAKLADKLLPNSNVPLAEQRRAIEELHRQLRMDLALYDAHGRLLGNAGQLPALAPQRLAERGWALSHSGPLWILPLSDGRRLVVRPEHMPHAPGAHVLLIPISLVLAFALGAYPIARRLTRRLALLQEGVEQLGAGDLSARVHVSGHDEVAALARSFNSSAEQIEALVHSHKLLLANCSHELRTPLARIRLGLERMPSTSDRSVHDELARSITELDTLIGEMLLSSRLDALRTLERTEEVDLLALVAEEASHFDRSVEGQAVTIYGDPSLLRRMVRNLLDNAQRHAGGATRVYVGRATPANVELNVDDGGAGVPDNERDKIFEPFYRSSRAAPETKGFGLGLALVRQIAHAHGAEVHCTALPEGGSRFTVCFPVTNTTPRVASCAGPPVAD